MNYIKKIIIVFAVFGLILIAYETGNADSLFSDAIINSGFTLNMAEWIAEISMTPNPPKADGSNGWYISPPCIALNSSLPDTSISYDLASQAGNVSGTYSGVCFSVPDGMWKF